MYLGLQKTTKRKKKDESEDEDEEFEEKPKAKKVCSLLNPFFAENR